MLLLLLLWLLTLERLFLQAMTTSLSKMLTFKRLTEEYQNTSIRTFHKKYVIQNIRYLYLLLIKCHLKAVQCREYNVLEHLIQLIAYQFLF